MDRDDSIKYTAEDELKLKKEMERQKLSDKSFILSDTNVNIPYKAFEQLKTMAISSIEEDDLYILCRKMRDLFDEKNEEKVLECFRNFYENIVERNKRDLL